MQLRQFLLPTAIAASLALSATGAKADDVGPCPQLNRSSTRVIIGASTQYRQNVIWNVVVTNGLQGKGYYCLQPSGKTVWISNQINSKDEAVRLFSLFQDAGLIRPIKMRRTF